MIKIFTTLVLTTLCSLVFAQVTISDSVSLDASYTEQSFYSLYSGEQANVSNQNWDLQIWTNAFSASVRINSGAGVQLFAPVANDTSDWATVDTTGMMQLHDSDTSWELSATQALATGHPNYGWGYYIGSGNIVGIQIFVIKLHDGSWKKFRIDDLTFGTYHFTVANLDGSSETSFSITKTDYTPTDAEKHFVYYDIVNDMVRDIEPAGYNWDIVFRKYDAMIAPNTYYGVTGALSSPYTRVAEVNDLPTSNNDYSGRIFEYRIDKIGHDWKSFNMSTFEYDIADSLAYFIEDQTGNIYKLVFTEFEGGSTGDIVFAKTSLTTAIAEVEDAIVGSLSLYPNPMSANSQVVFSADEATKAELNIFDLTGQSVYNNTIDVKVGINQYPIGSINLNQGIYIVSLNDGVNVLSQRMVVLK